MKRVACFAHFDKNNEIQDYVVYYLKELKKAADTIIFVSDSDVSNSELEKIKPYIKHAITGGHGEYDFGSYKRGYIYAEENNYLKDCEELIFANDSCYAPLFPFEEMFSKMSFKNVDFWGNTENNEGINNVVLPKKHVQSYFMVFKPQVFNNEVFKKFIRDIKKEESKEQIIAKYEIGLSDLLIKNGFKYDVYCELSKETKAAFIFKYKDLIIKNKNPFLKRSIVLYRCISFVYPIFIENFIKLNSNYNSKLIKKDKKKNADKVNHMKCLLSALKELRRKYLLIHLNKKQKKIILFGKTLLNKTISN